MEGFEIIHEPGRGFDVANYMPDDHIRTRIGFSTASMPEDLHFEQGFEFLIPQNAKIAVKICPVPNWNPEKGPANDGELPEFEEVLVSVGQVLVIHPGYCHKVIRKHRFIALKAEGKIKIQAKRTTDNGACLYTECTLWDYCAANHYASQESRTHPS